MIAIARFLAILPVPLQNAESAGLQGKMALNFRASSGARSGHNNIKLNPVFRGMVRSSQSGTGLSTKGNLC